MKKYHKVLILPDIHAPWVNWGAINQAKKWADFHEPDLIIQLGDLTDQKIWSRWQKDVDDYSPSQEFLEAKKVLQKLHTMFPKMTILRGNHDERIKAKAIEVGIPGEMFKDIDEMFNFKGWKWHPRGEPLIIDTPRGEVYFFHGDEFGGTPAQKSRSLGVSVITGHTHKASTTYTQTPKGHFFGADMGTLMDVDSKAAKYAAANPIGSSVGFGVLKHGVPYFITYIKGSRV